MHEKKLITLIIQEKSKIIKILKIQIINLKIVMKGIIALKTIIILIKNTIIKKKNKKRINYFCNKSRFILSSNKSL